MPDNSHEKYQEIQSKLPLSSLSGVESVRVVSYIQNIQEKATEAIRLAQHYRNVAENIRGEKLKKEIEMETRVASVRNFWRNNKLLRKGHHEQGKWFKWH